jgi:GT2 family glycosyltransferase/predicted Zn-dependent protease
MDTYWKDAAHVVRPREDLAPILLINCQASEHQHIREYSGERTILLGAEYGVLHHLSYAGPDERIQRKISTWGHRSEVTEEWYRKSWKGWELDPTLNDLHPTHPHCYQFVERIEPIPMLAQLPSWREQSIAKPKRWPTVSVVIPLHGGPEDIRQCLDSLAKIQDLFYEVIVVDDASPDSAAEVAGEFGFVTLLKNETNKGFAGTCNGGYSESSGDVVFFLNSDTIVPRPGLIRLVEGLMESGTVGVAGPVSNNVGYYQQVKPTYTDLKTLDLFAEDLALSEREDRDVEMLVGFALAVRRSVIEEVAEEEGKAFDERFLVGMFEDTDLCYRIARAGYSLRLCSRAYVHHWGSRTLQRTVPDPAALLHKNGAVYRSKWQQDLDLGFASHLPGLNMQQGLVQFNKTRHPDKWVAEIDRLKMQADISLCMIVKNEERVLGDCLKSVKPFFKEILILDTGSTDRTVEIAKEHGAQVSEMIWPNSFAAARTASMIPAKGKWLFWCDADDTLPASCGEMLLHTAIKAKKETVGFIVPVQFVDSGPGAGTRVDHVKLFRNVPGLEWEGRIHEQILASLRRHGEIERSQAYVLHSGYDTSLAGQANKRERDWPLLWADHNDRPKHPFPLFNIGMTYHFTGRHQEAVEWMDKCLAVSQPQESHVRKAYDLKGVSQRELGQLEEALATFQAGIDVVGNDPELRYNQGNILASQGKYKEALESYEAMHVETSGHFSSLDVGILGYKRSHMMAQMHRALGNYRQARDLFHESLNANGGHTPAAFDLLDAAIENADWRSAQTALDFIFKSQGPSANWAECVARLADESQGTGAGLQRLQAEINAHPEDHGVRLVFARMLLHSRHIAIAEPHLQLLAQSGVAEAAFFLGVTRIQMGNWEEALMYTEQAHLLDPGSEKCREQLEKLRSQIAPPPPSILSELEQAALLTGPYAGKLGKGTKGVSVVIVTYNSEAYIGPCLASVLPTLGKIDEVLIVDNASTDGTIDEARKPGDPRIKVIASATNDGYSKAANKGLLASKGKVLVLLNPDTVVSPNWLTAIKTRLTKGVGAVGPVSDNVSGDQFAGHYLPPNLRPHYSALGELFTNQFEGKSADTRLIIGMCMMLSRTTLDEVGLLDEDMILGADDLDLSWRLVSLGYKLVIALDAFVHHESGASFAKRPREQTSFLIQQSDEAFLRKLKRYYGEDLPGSYCLFGCAIWMEALARNKQKG